MNSALRRFNLNLLATRDRRIPGMWLLLLLLPLAFVGGCAGNKTKVQPTVLRVHVESSSSAAFTKKIKVFESSSTELVVDESPLLTEMDVEKASVVNALGGSAISIKFSKRGQWLLDSYTSLNMGRHLAVFAQYGSKPVKTRWLAAPLIVKRISDGVMLFTPAVEPEDVEAIAKGLNDGKDKPKKKSANDW